MVDPHRNVMDSLTSRSDKMALAGEWLAVALLAAMVAAWLNFQRGYFSWSWDAINHHVYLGYIAQSPRWHLDITAAASQTYQYPYLYWPAYRISLLSGNGALYAALWAGAQALLLAAPLWLIAYRLLPRDSTPVRQRIERMAAVLLGMSSAPVLAALGTTANDALAAVPVLWAAALGLAGAQRTWSVTAAAVLLGIAIAFKLSNVVYLPVLFALAWRGRPATFVLGSLRLGFAMLVGFAVAYAPWGWQLWQATGNPFYPYFQWAFAR